MAMKVQCNDVPATIHTLYDGASYVQEEGQGKLERSLTQTTNNTL